MFNEDMLEVENGSLGYLVSFNLNFPKSKQNKSINEILKNSSFKNIEFEGEFQDHFSMAKDFLFKHGLPQNCERVKIDSTFFEIKDSSIVKFKSFNETDVYLAVYKDLNLGVLLFNFDISECSTDDIIFLRQCIYGKFPVEFRDLSFTGTSTEIFNKLDDLIKLYVGKIKSLIESNYSLNEDNSEIMKERIRNINIVGSFVIEIKALKNYKVITNVDKDVINKNIHQFYGLATCDEGYRFVPHETAKKGIDNRWSSRNFMSIILFNFGVLSINLIDSDIHLCYIENQTKLRLNYGKNVENYFTMLKDSKIAGLCHGILLMLEEAAVIRLMINNILDSSLFKKNRRLNVTFKTRRQIVDTVNKVSTFGIMEIDTIEEMIANKMFIYEDIEKVKYNLDINESELHIKYEKLINIFFIIFTFVQVFIAIISFR